MYIKGSNREEEKIRSKENHNSLKQLSIGKRHEKVNNESLTSTLT